MESTFDLAGEEGSRARRGLERWTTAVFLMAKSAGFFLLPSPFAASFGTEANHLPNSSHVPEGTAYLDGVRGLAATIVFIEHFALPFYPGMVGVDKHQEWSYLQLPIVRLFYHGSFAVCVFFVISGFVLSRKLIRLERQALDCGGTDHEEADRSTQARRLHDAFRSAIFRRAPRILLPVIALVLLVAALAFAFDAFAVGARFPGLPRNLYRLDVPRQLPTFAAQLKDCLDFYFSQIVYPFMWMRDIPRSGGQLRAQTYGFHLWTIPVEFWASEMLFVVLLATSLRKRFARPMLSLLISSYSAWCGRWEPPLYLAGAHLADLDISGRIADTTSNAEIPALQCRSQARAYTSLHRRSLQTCLGVVMCVTGLWIGSIPDYDATRMFGFVALASLCDMPGFIEVYWQGLGAVLFVWSLRYCRWLRRFFELSVFQYLGQVSFALYLVHIPIITSFGWAIAGFLLGLSGKGLDAMGWDRDLFVLVGGLLSFAASTWVADIFWRAFDAPSVRLSKYLDNLSAIC